MPRTRRPSGGREKRNARRAEGAAKARAKSVPPQVERKLQAEPEPAAVPATEGEEEIPYYSLDLLPPRTEQQLESNTPFDSKDILTRRYKRPARRVVPSLSQVSLLPGSELKETFSTRLRTDEKSVLPQPDRRRHGPGFWPERNPVGRAARAAAGKAPPEGPRAGGEKGRYSEAVCV